jgi:hypothetical protein
MQYSVTFTAYKSISCGGTVCQFSTQGKIMKKHWMIVLAMLVFAIGCDQKQKEEDAEKYAEQDAKVAEAVKNQKRGAMTKPDEGSGKEPAEDTGKDDAAEKTDETETPETKENKDDTSANEKTETSSKLIAKTVLNEAIATAKADNKALFVHFTADW